MIQALHEKAEWNIIIFINYKVVTTGTMHLLTPVRATYEEDIRVRHDFLNSARDLFEVGFEVILPGGYEGDLKQSDTIRRNLAEYSENDGFFLALHAPLERTNYQESPMDLTTERGMDTLIEVLRLANQINARIVNVHSEYMRTEDALLGVYYDDIKLRLREAIVKNIAGAYTAASYRGIIALENSPLPAMRDDHSFKSKEAMLFEPLIDSPYGMKFFSDRGTYLCFDTCHADITARTLSAMVEGSDPRFGALELSDVYNLPIAETMPEPMTATLKGLNTVKYIHFSASRFPDL